MPGKIGVVAGLKRELRCIGLRRPPHLLTFAAAGSPDRAHARAQGWIASGRVTALASFGLCGGLDPSLKPGMVVVSHEIVLPEGGAYLFDSAWARAVAGRIPGARIAPLLGAREAAVTTAEKRDLFQKTGAAVVDMESRGVAEAAREAKLPFVAIRAVADPADRTLPKVATDAINAHGRLRPLRVLFGLLARPGDLGALLSLAKEAGLGYDALAKAVRYGVLAAELLPR